MWITKRVQDRLEKNISRLVYNLPRSFLDSKFLNLIKSILNLDNYKVTNRYKLTMFQRPSGTADTLTKTVSMQIYLRASNRLF